MTYKKLYENCLEEFKNVSEDCNKLKKELLEVYKYLYPEYDVINYVPTTIYNPLNNPLILMRAHHEKQLEKEKMKKLIKECMGEIKQ